MAEPQSDENLLLGQSHPNSLEAEQAVLGSMLLSEDAIMKAGESLKPEDFYRVRHQVIFEMVLTLSDKAEPVDMVTLINALRDLGKLEEIGGQQYLIELYNIIPSPANIDHYASIVKRKSNLRQIIAASHKMLEACQKDDGNVEAILDGAEATIFGLTQQSSNKPYHSMKDVITETFPLIEKLYDQKEALTGVPSGLRDLDKVTAGFQKSDLIILAARPSVGKTALTLGFVRTAAVVHRFPVLMFSLEMSRTQLAMRLLSMEAKIDGQSLRRGYFKEEQWGTLTSSASILSQSPLYLDDSPGLTIREMRSKCRRLKAEVGIELICIDYLQLMEAGTSKSESRQVEISMISRALKGIARELNVPVIALSQLSRKLEERTDKRPMLSDLRESGAIEQDADLVIFIHREDRYKKDTDRQGIAEIIVAKQRNGPLGTVEVTFIDKYSRFVDMAVI